jgi:hypothetical protein
MPESIRINFVTGATRRYVADVEALAAVPSRLETAFEGQSAAWLRTPMTGSEWSPARTAGHMIAYARQTHENLYRMAWMTDPLVKAPDDIGAAAENSWEARDQSRLLQWFSEAIAESVELLKELPDSSWGRPGQSPLTGRSSIRQTVREAARHLEGYVARIEGGRA